MNKFFCRFASYWLFWLLIFTAACKNDLAEVNRLISQEEIGVETMRDVEILYSDSAILRVRIKSPVLLRHTDVRKPYEEFPEGVEVDFYDPLGRSQSRLTANYAIRLESEGQIIARDSVVWKSQKQEKLETEELIWEEAERRIYSNKFVKITKPDEVIYGVGFETNQEFTRWKINAPEGEILVDEKQKPSK